MHRAHGQFSSSPTDLANFLACRHKTALDLLVVLGELTKPGFEDPLVDVLRERGMRHERAYVDALRASGLTVIDLAGAPTDAESQLLAAMQSGADVIVQAPLRANGWFGYADVLRRVERPSARLGSWSYEALDTKLARETKGGTILQLCVYSDIVGELQGAMPEAFAVVTPLREERYRFDDFAAFYRWAKAQYSAFIAQRVTDDAPSREATYPVPAEHCDVCRWWDRCNARRRHDDHLTFVAGLGRSHLAEWQSREVTTLAALAGVAIPLAFRPKRGARETYERHREQARVQREQRESLLPVYELLPPEPPLTGEPPTNVGLARLPAPSPGDLFLDLEGDPFARDGGREYLFGLWRPAAAGGSSSYEYVARWAGDDDSERAAFEWLVDACVAAVAADPLAHIYHFAPYEPAALKRLMGRYASREAEIDALLRGERFVDLHGVVRRGLRAGVESYSIKQLERFYGFARDVNLGHAADQRRLVEVALELGPGLAAIPMDVRAVVESYNRDDCRSTQALRDWLEELRREAEAAGLDIPRPAAKASEPPENVGERQQRVDALRPVLLRDVPADPEQRSADQHASYLVAYAMDWHRRESKAGWWDYFRLIELADDELLDERGAIAGLEFTGQRREVLNKRTGKPTGSVIDEYRYPEQDMEIRAGANLKTKDGKGFGAAESVDRDRRLIEIKKGRANADVHPASLFEHRFISPDVLEDSICRTAQAIAEAGGIEAGAPPLLRRLLLREAPAALPAAVAAAREIGDAAVSCVHALDGDVLAIQGPPGAGKTHTGARMICDLVAAGKRVGVTATSHKVIRNLLDAVGAAARARQLDIRLAHKSGAGDIDAGDRAVTEIASDDEMLLAMQTGTAVAGGTAWLFANEQWTQPGHTLDVLFVDEAGQMSLANVLAVAPAARNLVLLGDPRQLDQPLKGSHPDGLAVSVLEHILGDAETMPADRGLFLPITHRLAPAIAAFTSEVFYERKLHARDGLERQRLTGTRFDGAGLWTIAVAHEGCQNASDEEVAAIVDLVAELTAPGSRWFDASGNEHEVSLADVLIVAPYNAQVARLKDKLPAGARVGTVDKFQGQEAPVVIYSMTASDAAEAPRGIEFLYSPNRLNVATSRARCACLLVASPRLFDPECRTPRQMQLASALCRFRELSRIEPLRG